MHVWSYFLSFRPLFHTIKRTPKCIMCLKSTCLLKCMSLKHTYQQINVLKTNIGLKFVCKIGVWNLICIVMVYIMVLTMCMGYDLFLVLVTIRVEWYLVQHVYGIGLVPGIGNQSSMVFGTKQNRVPTCNFINESMDTHYWLFHTAKHIFWLAIVGFV